MLDWVRRTALLLLISAAGCAQPQLDAAFSAVVRISGTQGGTPVHGTGFVVDLDRDNATIVTAAHVVEGVQQIEVTFGADLTERFRAGAPLGVDPGSPGGLAALPVRGKIPPGITVLSLKLDPPPIGKALYLLGFPDVELEPRTSQRVLSARRGKFLLIDQEVGDGFSGGPALEDGRVVGVVTDTDSQTTYALNALEVFTTLLRWGLIKSVPQSTPPASTPYNPFRPHDNPFNRPL